MSHETKYDRRRFLGDAFKTLGATELAMMGVDSRPDRVTLVNESAPATNASQSPNALKQIDAGVLNIGYAETGSANGKPVVLLHGWPYDINSFADVVPLLASAGYRVIVPYLRGYGTTSFLSAETLRNGQQSVIAVDIIALMDVLKIQQAIIAGFDWGARTACIMAALVAGTLQRDYLC